MLFRSMYMDHVLDQEDWTGGVLDTDAKPRHAMLPDMGYYHVAGDEFKMELTLGPVYIVGHERRIVVASWVASEIERVPNKCNTRHKLCYWLPGWTQFR